MADQPEPHRVASAALGASQAANTAICTVTGAKGRCTIRGMARHTLADGVKLMKGPAGSLVLVATFPNAAGSVTTFPNITLDLITNDIVQLQLAVATGASDNAFGLLTVQQEDPL